MTRILVLIAMLVMAPVAFAQSSDDIIRGGNTPKLTTVAGETAVIGTKEAQALLANVSDVNAIQIARLLEQIAAVTSGKDGSMATLFAIQSELTRQTGAFKKAQSSALSGNGQDVDALFAEVIDGKTGGADAEHLSRVTNTYEALLTQFGQLVNSKFLASNSGGIATYRGEQHASDAAAIGAEAATRSTAYAANVDRASLELRGLLALDATH